MKISRQTLIIVLLALAVVGLGGFILGQFLVKDKSQQALENETDVMGFDLSNIYDGDGRIKNVDAQTAVGLFEYKGLSIPKSVHEVSDDVWKTELSYMLQTFQEPEYIKDRAIRDGDLIHIDFVGYIDGVPFENGSTDGQGYTAWAGSDALIDSFLTKIIGQKPETTVDILCTFPEDYHEETLKGKEAVFVTTVNYIIEDPEFNDEFVTKHLTELYGWSNVAEAETGVKKMVSDALVYEYISDQFYKYIEDYVDMNKIPSKVTAYYEYLMLRYFLDLAQAENMTLVDFVMWQMGLSGLDALKENYKEFNQTSSAYTLVVQAIAVDAGIVVEDAELEKYKNPEASPNEHELREMKNGLVHERVIKLITENSIYE